MKVVVAKLTHVVLSKKFDGLMCKQIDKWYRAHREKPFRLDAEEAANTPYSRTRVTDWSFDLGLGWIGELKGPFKK